MTDLLEGGTTEALRNSPAHAQVIRRWVAAGFPYLFTVLGALATFGGTSAIGNPTPSGISASAQLFLVGMGACLALLCVLPTVGLARRVRLRSAKAGVDVPPWGRGRLAMQVVAPGSSKTFFGCAGLEKIGKSHGASRSSPPSGARSSGSTPRRTPSGASGSPAR